MRNAAILIMIAATLMLSCACAETDGSVRSEIYAMDTIIRLSIWGSNASATAEAIRTEILRLESLLSVTDTESLISQINAADNAIKVTTEVKDLLNEALSYHVASEGASDITVAPIVQAWGFTGDSYRIPEAREIQELLASVGGDHILLLDDSVTLTNHAKIDLGAIAKGYTADRIAQILDEYNIASALISLGGNVYLHNCKPDGSTWRVALIDPTNTDDYAGVLSLTNAFAVTSGGYQRYFDPEGQRYHHIIDPFTGYPAQSNLLSVTIISSRGQAGEALWREGTMCDALSTALYVMGEERAIEFWRDVDYPFDFAFITEDGRLLAPAGMEDYFEPSKMSGYEYEIVY